ncbi:MAG: hypothetical protein NWF04_05240 [Candidatus Bathyarchaeota archaeon]|nr:hypothetical protein [Candidatus Bathyarchaeota archaeon]
MKYEKELVDMTTEMMCRFKEYVEKSGMDWMEPGLCEAEAEAF